MEEVGEEGETFETTTPVFKGLIFGFETSGCSPPGPLPAAELSTAANST